jgi:hypothetical protein
LLLQKSTTYLLVRGQFNYKRSVEAIWFLALWLSAHNLIARIEISRLWSKIKRLDLCWFLPRHSLICKGGFLLFFFRNQNLFAVVLIAGGFKLLCMTLHTFVIAQIFDVQLVSIVIKLRFSSWKQHFARGRQVGYQQKHVYIFIQILKTMPRFLWIDYFEHSYFCPNIRN